MLAEAADEYIEGDANAKDDADDDIYSQVKSEAFGDDEAFQVRYQVTCGITCHVIVVVCNTINDRYVGLSFDVS